MRHFRRIITATALVVALLAATTVHAQEGTLQTIRTDVRQGAPESPAPPPSPSEPPRQESPKTYDGSSSSGNSSDSSSDDMMSYIALAGGAVTFPFWGPHMVLGDDFQVPGYFPRYPYADGAGYMVGPEWTGPKRTMCGRFDIEYIESFDDVSNVGGHLLVSSQSRFELDMEAHRLEERLPTDDRDRLWLGDCNLTYRFAQSGLAQFRAGVGVNWLTDDRGTDLGFNFTYGADVFPVKPWIISSSIDVGTLGRASLFRFRTTLGVEFHRIEAYTGYEFSDIERTECHGLIGGLRLWF